MNDESRKATRKPNKKNAMLMQPDNDIDALPLSMAGNSRNSSGTFVSRDWDGGLGAFGDTDDLSNIFHSETEHARDALVPSCTERTSEGELESGDVTESTSAPENGREFKEADTEEETELGGGAMDTERPGDDVVTGSDLEGGEGLMTDMVVDDELDPLVAEAARAVQADAVAVPLRPDAVAAPVASMQTDAVAEPLESETPQMQGRRTRRVHTTLTDVDVVQGRGELANNHPGNIRLREERDKLKPTYQKTERNKRKPIAEKLVRMVHGWGGAFLDKDQGDGDTWSEIGDDKAIKKCQHLLREDKKAPSKRKQPPGGGRSGRRRGDDSSEQL